MGTKLKDICDGYAFHFLEDVDVPAVELMAVGRESRNDRSYFWDNRDRPPAFLFQYTLSGSGTLKTEGEAIKVDAGKGFFLQFPDEEIYYFDENNNEAPWEFLYIVIRGAGVMPYYQYYVKRFGKIASLSLSHPAILKLFDLHMLAKCGRIRNAFVAGKEAFDFLCLLCSGEEEVSKGYSSLIENAIVYMEQNFQKELALSSLAEYLGVSQSHFSREFLKETGESPVRFLAKLRLEKAISLLNTTDMHLEEISGVCGFSDCNYFSKVFRKYMKVSPGRFRKQIRREGYVNVRI